jgi:hypothetical protein
MRPTLLLGTLACVALLAACSKQSEGERCDPSSGRLDCETGLVCRSADQLSIQGGAGVGLCCPPDGVEPSVTACRAGADLPDEPPPEEPLPSGDAGPVGDAG